MAQALMAAIALASCGGGSSSPPASQAPAPGATRVTGSERLAWNQTGDIASLRFLAYVDGSPVSLNAAACNGAAPEAECSAPLPPLTDGVHTIAVAAQSASSGAESERSEAVTVQKVSARSVVSVASLPDAGASPAGPRFEATVASVDGRTFAADVVGRSFESPLQLATTPDGRVLVAEAGGRVHVVRPSDPDRRQVALDARALLDPPPAGTPSVAVHPDFAENRFVYLSFLAEEGAGSLRLHLVRLREAGDTLGEPATLFDAPLVVSAQPPPLTGGPRVAFGPDRLLYVLLPPGIEFANEAGASRSHASMVRLGDDGRLPAVGPLTGIVAHPLGFAWHPNTRVLWGIVPTREGDATVEPLGGSAGVLAAGAAALRLREGSGRSSGALVVQEMGTLAWALAMAAGLDFGALGSVRLAVPMHLEGVLDGFAGRLVDVVTDGGTIYVAAEDVGESGAAAGDRSGVVVRLRPR
jgi:hypothetical protein